MNKDVLIHVRGLQMMETDDAQEPIEIVVPGQYYFRNGSHYLRTKKCWMIPQRLQKIISRCHRTE